MAINATGKGYWLASADGDVHAEQGAPPGVEWPLGVGDGVVNGHYKRFALVGIYAAPGGLYYTLISDGAITPPVESFRFSKRFLGGLYGVPGADFSADGISYYPVIGMAVLGATRFELVTAGGFTTLAGAR